MIKWLPFLGVLFLVGCASQEEPQAIQKENSAIEVNQPTDSTGEQSRLSESEREEMEVIMTIDGEVYPITLNDSEAANNFKDRLPITLTLSDYASTEKVSDFPSPLDLGDSPRGHQPVAGDITVYEPWGNLAIFYKEFNYSSGLVSLGTIDDGVDMLMNHATDFEVTFSASAIE